MGNEEMETRARSEGALALDHSRRPEETGDTLAYLPVIFRMEVIDLTLSDDDDDSGSIR